MKRGCAHALGTLILAFLLAASPAGAADRRRIRHKRPVPMKATAYAQKGTTASGEHTRRGIVAADPQVIPLGSTVQVSGAGPYSGRYKVKDTGKKIKGRRIDIFTPSRREARKFGKKTVMVRVIKPPDPIEDPR